MGESVGIGVIGCGAVARNYHLPALQALEGARLVAAADLVPERAQEAAARFGFDEWYTDYRQVLDRPDVDAVLVLTTYHPKRELLLAAAAAGKHIFTQKPLAAAAAEGQELVAAARRAGVRLVTSFMHNYWPETRAVKRLLEEDAIGRVQFVRQRNAIHSTYDTALTAGGATWDIGPHGVALIEHLTDTRIARVQAMMDAYARPAAERDIRDGRAVDTMAIMNYTLADGRLVTHEVDWCAQAGTMAWTTELFGRSGGILLRPHAAAGLVLLAQQQASGAAGPWQVVEVPLDPGAARVSVVRAGRPSGVYHHQLFVDDVRFDRFESASPEDGLSTLRVLEAVYRSAAEGVAVDVR